MEKIIALVKALNAVKKANFYIEAYDGKISVAKVAEGKLVERYFIKERPVAQPNGVEEFEFVARKENR